MVLWEKHSFFGYEPECFSELLVEIASCRSKLQAVEVKASGNWTQLDSGGPETQAEVQLHVHVAVEEVICLLVLDCNYASYILPVMSRQDAIDVGLSFEKDEPPGRESTVWWKYK